MRLRPISPDELTAEQRPFYDDMQAFIAKNFQGFKSFDDKGALIGPFNPWLQEPQFGKPIWELAKTMSTAPSLPPTVREVAIRVVGGKFHAPYEIYAHVALAERRGLPDGSASGVVRYVTWPRSYEARICHGPEPRKTSRGTVANASTSAPVRR